MSGTVTTGVVVTPKPAPAAIVVLLVLAVLVGAGSKTIQCHNTTPTNVNDTIRLSTQLSNLKCSW
jgi:hypothetical protein